MSGKGSAPRPLSVDAETYAANWARAFGAVAVFTPCHGCGCPGMDGTPDDCVAADACLYHLRMHVGARPASLDALGEFRRVNSKLSRLVDATATLHGITRSEP
jgi:hypothetical protein